MQATVKRAAPFEWNLPETTPGGIAHDSTVWAGKPQTVTTSEQPITSTDGLMNSVREPDELVDPVLHR